MILAALAAGAGIARGVAGIIGAGKKARGDRDLIKRAYQIAKRRLNEDQSYTRQGLNESLNARGILNGGANVQRSQTVTDALKGAGVDPDAPTKAAFAKGDVMGVVKSFKGRKDRMAAYENARMATDAERGQSGQGNTLTGQANSDLSREFYGEQQDLFSEREQGINATKAEQAAATVNAIGSGIDVGTSVYNAGSLIKGALASGANPAGVTKPAGSESGSGVALGNKHYFAGIDPVNPLGLGTTYPLRNDQFNVKKKGY